MVERVEHRLYIHILIVSHLKKSIVQYRVRSDVGALLNHTSSSNIPYNHGIPVVHIIQNNVLHSSGVEGRSCVTVNVVLIRAMPLLGLLTVQTSA